MLIEEVARYLSQQGIGTFDPEGLGGDIFLGVLPNQPDEAIALYPTGGQGANSKLGYDLPTFQILVRGDQDIRTGYAIAQMIYNTLHGFRSKTFVPGGQWIVSCLGLQSAPVHLGPDANRRHEFSLNFIVDTRNPDRE